MPIPDPHNLKERTISYVFAPSGSGKTYFSAAMLRSWMKLNDGDVYVFSTLDDDAVIANLGERIHRVNIGTLVDHPIDIKEILHGSMVFLEDCDYETNPKIKNAIQQLANQVYQIGRHQSTSCITTSHMGGDNKYTRIVLRMPQYHSDPLLRQLAAGTVRSESLHGHGQQIREIKTLKSRWVPLGAVQ